MPENRRLLTATCYLSLMSYAITVAGWGPCVSLLQTSFHIGDSGIGALRTALFGGFTISVFSAGWAMHRFGLKSIAVVGPGAMGVSLIAFSVSPGYGHALLFFFLAGLSAGLLETVVNTIVSEMGGDNRAEALNMMHVFFGVGAFAASRGAGLLLEHGGTWRTLYGIFGGIALVVSLMFIPQSVPHTRHGDEPGAADILAFIRKPLVFLLGICIFFYMGYEVGLNDWVVPYLERFSSFGGDKKSASDLFAWFWLAIAAGRLVCTFISRAVGPRVLLIIITSLTAAASVFIFAVREPAAIAILLSLSAFFSAGIFPTTLAIAGNSYPKNVGTVNGIIMGFVGIATVLFPVAIGTISQMFDLKVALVAVCVCLVAMVAGAALAPRFAPAESGGNSQ